jgi:hypothetical protein
VSMNYRKNNGSQFNMDLRDEYDQLVLKAVRLLPNTTAAATPVAIARYIHGTPGGGDLVEEALERLEDGGLVKGVVDHKAGYYYRCVDALSQVAKAAADAT